MLIRKQFPKWSRIWTALGGAVLLFALVAVLVVRLFPSVGATGADQLRHILGDENVARLEAVLFKVDDSLKNLEYRLGIAHSVASWQVSTTPISPTAPGLLVQGPAIASAQKSKATSPGISAIKPGTPGKVSNAPTLSLWVPNNLQPMGHVAGEGVWVPYIQDNQGRVIAYRTFLQPDPSRPYALVAVVALNLQDVKLHFVLGTSEPYDQGVLQRASGAIPAADLQPGQLLATFNGGFKVAHGHFGAMAGGLVAVPPKTGLATLVIDQNGMVKMGEWGVDISPSQAYLAYRQNGVLIVKNGVVTPQVDNPSYWGFTISGKTVTWRSAIGLDASGKVLYYFAGGYLNINTLANAISHMDAQTAMQLDINNYWVHFDAIRTNGNNLISEPLFKEMNQNPDRYLKPWIRDFFYVVSK